MASVGPWQSPTDPTPTANHRPGNDLIEELTAPDCRERMPRRRLRVCF